MHSIDYPFVFLGRRAWSAPGADRYIDSASCPSFKLYFAAGKIVKVTINDHLINCDCLCGNRPKDEIRIGCEDCPYYNHSM